ncbi:MAG: glycoside hydrolase family 3 N-terminal domain-containing protein [Verrucomicrobiota bacterium]
MLPIILGLDGPELTSADRHRISAHQPAGYILFSRNIISAQQTRQLTDQLRELSDHPPRIAIDNEGGRVWRTSTLGPTPPDAATFATKADYKQAAQFGALAGRHLEMLGINLNFAPVLDIDHQPKDANALRGRCWGHDSQTIIDNAGNFNRWLRKNGVLSCGKHFPAGGRARLDPHHELPVVEANLEQLLADDLLPYTALGPELDGIMTAHIRYPAIDPEMPSSLSRRLITELLRDQLGYPGLIFTDDLDMGAITKHYGRGPDFELAWLAGNDLPLLCHELTTTQSASNAFQQLPQPIRFDIEDRLERTLKTLKPPPPYSSSSFQKNNEDLRKLTHDITGQDSFQSTSPTQSPVEDY